MALPLGFAGSWGGGSSSPGLTTEEIMKVARERAKRLCCTSGRCDPDIHRTYGFCDGRRHEARYPRSSHGQSSGRRERHAEQGERTSSPKHPSREGQATVPERTSSRIATSGRNDDQTVSSRGERTKDEVKGGSAVSPNQELGKKSTDPFGDEHAITGEDRLPAVPGFVRWKEGDLAILQNYKGELPDVNGWTVSIDERYHLKYGPAWKPGAPRSVPLDSCIAKVLESRACQHLPISTMRISICLPGLSSLPSSSPRCELEADIWWTMLTPEVRSKLEGGWYTGFWTRTSSNENCRKCVQKEKKKKEKSSTAADGGAPKCWRCRGAGALPGKIGWAVRDKCKRGCSHVKVQSVAQKEDNVNKVRKLFEDMTQKAADPKKEKDGEKREIKVMLKEDVPEEVGVAEEKATKGKGKWSKKGKRKIGKNYQGLGSSENLLNSS